VSLHAKSVVFDRATLLVGSFNVNLRSACLNGETVLIVHSPALAERVARDIDRGMAAENSWLVSRDTDGRLRWTSEGGAAWTREPATGWWRRLKSATLTVLPIGKYL
jgi:putative cardiolipin synthase